MVSQLMDGLRVCGVLEAIQKYPEQMRAMFVMNEEEIDEDSFLDLFHVDFSLEQMKKVKEIDTFKVFSDFVSMVYHKGLLLITIQFIFLKFLIVTNRDTFLALKGN